MTPVVPHWAPDEVRAETERAYELGHAPEPEAAPARGFPRDEDEAAGAGVPGARKDGG